MKFLKILKTDLDTINSLRSFGFLPIMIDSNFAVYDLSDELSKIFFGKYSKANYVVSDKLLF